MITGSLNEFSAFKSVARGAPGRGSLTLGASSDDEDRRRLEEMLSGSSSSSEDDPSIGRNNLESFLTDNSGPKLSTPPRQPSRSKQPQSKVALLDDQTPVSQQPAQEFEDLKAAPMYSWGQLEDIAFAKRLALLYGGVFVVVSLPIALTTYQFPGEVLPALLSANVGTLALVAVLMVRLAVGWSYIGDRLTKDVGYYEDSGWYDGYMAVKPPEIRNRDKLLFDLEVQPAVERVKKFTGGAGTALVASMLLLGSVTGGVDPYSQVCVASSPIFSPVS